MHKSVACVLMAALLFGSTVNCSMAQGSLTGGVAFKTGVATHLFRGDRPIEASLDALSAAGVSAVREDATWARVEVSQGVYSIPKQWDDVVNEASRRGIEVLLVLAYGNKFYDHGDKPRTSAAISAYTEYAAFVAAHFRGKVRLYEVWNEWDGRVGNTTSADPESYVKLAKATFLRLKKADPGAIVLAGSLTSYGVEKGDLRRMIDLGLLEATDGVPIHVYTYCRQDPGPRSWLDTVESVESDLKWRFGTSVPIYVTETGWSTFDGKCGVDEATQADYLGKVYDQAKSLPYIKGVWWYDLQDDGRNDAEMEDNFGLLRNDMTPKPAYLELKKRLGR